MKAWITKYALTKGIQEIEAEVCENVSADMIKDLSYEARWQPYYHGEGREWHRTRSGAIARAEEMRQKKIASLKKQIKKFEALRFE